MTPEQAIAVCAKAHKEDMWFAIWFFVLAAVNAVSFLIAGSLFSFGCVLGSAFMGGLYLIGAEKWSQYHRLAVALL